ncbi:MAG: dienelactone hydrolase family protein [Halobacteriaceae archaeon]
MEPDAFDPGEWTHELFAKQPRRHAFAERGDATVAEWQAPFREDLRETLGHDVIAAAGVPDLDPVRRSVEQRDGYVEEDWTVHSESGLRVPFYLLVPDDADPPYPTVLAAHGHTSRARELTVGHWETEDQRGGITEQERDVARQAVRRGYAAIAPDMRGFGALGDASHDGRDCSRMQHHAQLFGRSLVGDRTWDVSRLVDFAAAEDRLDADRVAVTGHSGGGTVALFAAAADERIDVAVPCSYFCALEDSIGSISHCDCNYLPGIVELGELWDVAGLIAPRPFLAIAGREDTIFPLDGVERAFEHLESVYEAAGAADRCELYVGDGGHRYYAAGAWPFVDEYL